MAETTRCVGLDVHKDTIAVAVADDGSPESLGTIANDPSAVRKLVTRLTRPGMRIQVAYEAGPTGYALHRQLTRLGVQCMVVAPSLVPRRPGDRVKTDRRDALMLARLLRTGDLTPVWIPDEAHEALRDLVRARADAQADALRAKHRLTKFLLRRGVHHPPGMRPWTTRYDAWLHKLTFAETADQVVLIDYVAVVRAAVERVRRLETALHEVAPQSQQIRLIAALQAFRGIGFLTAVTIAAEVGDLRRFATARQFMAYVGVVPTEYSSGSSRHRGHITKTGNSLLRHVLGEAAHHARLVPNPQGAQRRRQDGLPPALIDISWRAQQRLHLRYRHLSARLGRPKALTAVSREFAGFVWAMGQELEASAA